MLLNLNLKKHDDLQHITVFEQVVNKIRNYTLDLQPHFLLKKFEFSGLIIFEGKIQLNLIFFYQQ